jgi:hypothetical protein
MSDWTTDAADAIERAVVTVRDKTVTPARTITRAVVYGVLAALFLLPAGIILLAGLFRGLVKLYQGEVWAAWLTLGGLFVLGGMVLWSKRNP